jgi:geranylgeranyl pyrophosphate synthase
MNPNLTTIEKILMEPVKYYQELKGKDIRKFFCKNLGEKLSISQDYIDKINNLINTIHNSSLVIDDIHDNSTLRRNNTASHIKYGIPMALNSGYFSIFHVLNNLNKDNTIHQNTKEKLFDNLYKAHIGQGLDIYYTQNKIIPSMEDYNTMMYYKTGMLFVSIIDLLMDKLLYKLDDDLVQKKITKEKYDIFLKGILKFSLFFQIRDDYINITDVKYWKEKGFCQDFDEQKISYLITYCTNKKMKNYSKINKLLNESLKTNEIKCKIILLMNKNGLFDIIYDKLNELKKEIVNILDIQYIFDQLPYSKFTKNNLQDFS